jgi:signal transduction histidine kinase
MKRQSVVEAFQLADESLNADGPKSAEHAGVLPVSIVRYGRQRGGIRFAPQLETISENSHHRLLGTALGERTHSTGRFGERLQSSLEWVFKTGDSSEFEWEFRTDGKPMWNAVLVVPEFGARKEVISALAVISDITTRKETELQLRALACRRISDRERERRRIAHALHDDLGQLLVALRMSVTLSRRTPGRESSANDEATNRTLTLVDAMIQSVRDVTLSLRPTMLDLGLAPALEWLITRFSRHTGIRCTLQTSGCDADMSEEHKIAIFRIAQEALTNAARHATAERIEVVFSRDENASVLEVRDNGKGFDAKHRRKTTSLGLIGMREWAIAAGGELAIFSGPLRGTVIRASIPVADSVIAEEC